MTREYGLWHEHRAVEREVPFMAWTPRTPRERRGANIESMEPTQNRCVGTASNARTPHREHERSELTRNGTLRPDARWVSRSKPCGERAGRTGCVEHIVADDVPCWTRGANRGRLRGPWPSSSGQRI
nr:MAG: hypothetical protein DIU78_07925 [Pseudomonadota bacterium]